MRVTVSRCPYPSDRPAGGVDWAVRAVSGPCFTPVASWRQAGKKSRAAHPHPGARSKWSKHHESSSHRAPPPPTDAAPRGAAH